MKLSVVTTYPGVAEGIYSWSGHPRKIMRHSKDFSVRLVNNSTTRTPATDMLYNTTNGRAHNNSTICCTTNSPPTNKHFLCHTNILTYICRDVGLWHCDVADNDLLYKWRLALSLTFKGHFFLQAPNSCQSVSSSTQFAEP